MKILHDITKAGLVATPNKDRTPIYDKPVGGQKIDAIDTNTTVGRTAGDILWDDNGKVWMRMNLTKVAAVNKKDIGWVRLDNVVLSKAAASPAAEGKAQGLINDMLKQDAAIVARLQRVYNAAFKLKKQGKDVTKITAIMSKLLSGVIVRQNKLKNTSGVKITKTLQTNIVVNDKSEISGIGVAPLVIAGAAVVVGSVATIALYYAFRPDYYDSKKDFVITADLEKMIDANISDPQKREELKQKIKETAQEQLQKAFEDGQTKQRFADIWSVGKYLAVGVGVYFLATNMNRNKK